MMTGRHLLLCLVLIATSNAALAAAPRASVSVTGESVTLGDVFDGIGYNADKVVLAAPAPGRTLVLDSRQLASLAAANGVAWQPLSTLDHTTITRQGQIMDGQVITAALPTALNLPNATLGTTSVVLDNPQLTLAAPMESNAELSFTSLQLDPTNNRFTGMALLRDGDTIYAQSPISGRVVTRLDVPVLSRLVRRGEVISATDIDWVKIDLTPAAQTLLHDASDLIGKTPRTSLRAGVPLHEADLTQPATIKRGTLVTMVFDSGNLHLTTRGRALNDAALGEMVKVANLSTSRTVEGIATSDGTVRIGDVLMN